MKRETITFEELRDYLNKLFILKRRAKGIYLNRNEFLKYSKFSRRTLEDDLKAYIDNDEILKNKYIIIDTKKVVADSHNSEQGTLISIQIKNLTIKMPDESHGILQIPAIELIEGMQAYLISHYKFENVSFEVETPDGSHSALFAIKLGYKSAIEIINNCIFENVSFLLEHESYRLIKISDSNFSKKITVNLIGNPNSSDMPIEISGNEINKIKLGSKQKFKFIDGNKINCLNINSDDVKIDSWSLREKIIMEEDKETIDTNRSAFMTFRNQAIKEGNRLHEILFQHHITECDEALIKLEPEGFARQEKITMLMGRIISNHGTSWLRPALILIIINFIIAVGATIPSGLDLLPSYSYSNYNFGDFLSVYFELFNPLGSLNNVACESGCLVKKVWWSSFLTVANKLTYAICAYEFIRAARRFTPR